MDPQLLSIMNASIGSNKKKCLPCFSIYGIYWNGWSNYSFMGESLITISHLKEKPIPMRRIKNTY